MVVVASENTRCGRVVRSVARWRRSWALPLLGKVPSLLDAFPASSNKTLGLVARQGARILQGILHSWANGSGSFSFCCFSLPLALQSLQIR